MTKTKLSMVLVFGMIMVNGCDKLAGHGSDSNNIQHSCTMNGLGAGVCQFTNTGQKAGAVCGKIRVHHRQTKATETSNVFCSGQVSPSSTTKTEFSIPVVNTFCDGNVAWTELCAFEFVRQ